LWINYKLTKSGLKKPGIKLGVNYKLFKIKLKNNHKLFKSELGIDYKWIPN